MQMKCKCRQAMGKTRHCYSKQLQCNECGCCYGNESQSFRTDSWERLELLLRSSSLLLTLLLNNKIQ